MVDGVRTIFLFPDMIPLITSYKTKSIHFSLKTYFQSYQWKKMVRFSSLSVQIQTDAAGYLFIFPCMYTEGWPEGISVCTYTLLAGFLCIE